VHTLNLHFLQSKIIIFSTTVLLKMEEECYSLLYQDVKFYYLEINTYLIVLQTEMGRAFMFQINRIKSLF
jgi:hypothetical protein